MQLLTMYGNRASLKDTTAIKIIRCRLVCGRFLGKFFGFTSRRPGHFLAYGVLTFSVLFFSFFLSILHKFFQLSSDSNIPPFHFYYLSIYEP